MCCITKQISGKRTVANLSGPKRWLSQQRRLLPSLMTRVQSQRATPWKENLTQQVPPQACHGKHIPHTCHACTQNKYKVTMSFKTKRAVTLTAVTTDALAAKENLDTMLMEIYSFRSFKSHSINIVRENQWFKSWLSAQGHILFLQRT